MPATSDNVLGGVYVEIAADTSKWRAGVASTKDEAKQLESLSPKVAIGLAGGEKLRADTQRAVASAAAGQRIGVPVFAETSGFRAQLAALPAMVKPIIVPVQYQIGGPPSVPTPLALPYPGGSGSGGFIPPTIISPAPSPALPGGDGSPGSRFVQSRVIASSSPSRAQLALPGSGDGAGAGPPPIEATARAAGSAERPIRNLNDALQALTGNSLQMAFRIGAAGQALRLATSGLRITADLGDYAAAPRGTPRGEAARTALQSSVENLNLLGAPVGEAGTQLGRVADMSGGQTAIGMALDSSPIGPLLAGVKLARKGVAWASGTQTAEEERASDEAVAKQEKDTARRLEIRSQRNKEAGAIIESTESGFATRGQAPAEATATLATRTRADYAEKLQNRTGITPQEDKALADLQKQETQAIADAKREQTQLVRVGAREQNQIIVSAGAERLRASGQTIEAEKIELKAGLDAEVEAAKDAVDQLKAEGASAPRIAIAEGRVTALASARQTRIEAQRVAQEREGQQVIDNANQGARVSGFRISGDNKQAEEQSIRDSFKPRLDEAKDKYGVNSPQYKAIGDEETKRLQELAVEREKDSQKQIIAAKSEAAVAGLRTTKQYLDAELKAYDDQTEAIKQQLKDRQATTEETNATLGARAAGRTELTTQQAEQRADTKAGYSTRQEVAAAEGKGQDQLAGVIGRIADLDKEARANKGGENEGEVRKTQIAELQSQEKQLTRPKGYARAYDSRFDAPGGPGGQAGAEMAEEIKRLRAARRERGDESVPSDDGTPQASGSQGASRSRRPSGRGPQIVSDRPSTRIGPAGETSDARAKREVAASHGHSVAGSARGQFDLQNARSDRQRAATRDINAKRATSEADRIAALPELTDPAARANRSRLVAGLRERGRLASPQSQDGGSPSASASSKPDIDSSSLLKRAIELLNTIKENTTPRANAG